MRAMTIILSVLGCFILFSAMMRVKADVGILVNKREQLIENQIQLGEDLRVLKAEVAYLNSPVRLEKMAIKMGMADASLTQFLGAL
ncbi:MAG: hypothetical protein WAX89_00675 [Alphaproteobacteria bacterium]